MIRICKHPSPLAPKKRWIRIFKVLTLTIAITVISDTEYYTITWKNDKKALLVRRVVDPVGTELIGKRFLSNEFNAAIPFQRTIKKTGLVTTELYKFDRKVGFCKNWHENLITIVIISKFYCLLRKLSVARWYLQYKQLVKLHKLNETFDTITWKVWVSSTIIFST